MMWQRYFLLSNSIYDVSCNPLLNNDDEDDHDDHDCDDNVINKINDPLHHIKEDAETLARIIDKGSHKGDPYKNKYPAFNSLDNPGKLFWMFVLRFIQTREGMAIWLELTVHKYTVEEMTSSPMSSSIPAEATKMARSTQMSSFVRLVDYYLSCWWEKCFTDYKESPDFACKRRLDCERVLAEKHGWKESPLHKMIIDLVRLSELKFAKRLLRHCSPDEFQWNVKMVDEMTDEDVRRIVFRPL